MIMRRLLEIKGNGNRIPSAAVSSDWTGEPRFSVLDLTTRQRFLKVFHASVGDVRVL
jgi:hypothetical protein